MRGWKKYIPCKWEAKESWSSKLISEKIDLKINKITRDKEGQYIMIKGSIPVSSDVVDEPRTYYIECSESERER